MSALGRFVIYGAGGIGGVLGARLYQHGADVALIARGRHLEAIREEGLGLLYKGDLIRLPIPAVADPAELDLTAEDVVVLAMKSQDTDPALAALAVSAPPEIAIVCAQNGVANERSALRYFPNVYGMCVTCPTGNLEPGIVEAYIGPITGRLDLGRYPKGVDATAEAIAAAIAESAYLCEARSDIMPFKYQKLLQNLGNGVWALTGRGERSVELVARLRREAEAVLEAAGIAVQPVEEFKALLAETRAGQTLPPTAGSTLQSFYRGTRSTETDFLNGEIVLLGRLHGVPTPANAAVADITRAAAVNGLAPESLTPDELWEQVGASP